MPIQPYSFFMPKRRKWNPPGSESPVDRRKADFRRFVFPGPNIVKEVPQMAKAGARVKITLRCNECKQRNYNTTKNKKNTPDRLEMNKYCPFCRKHTVHSETK